MPKAGAYFTIHGGTLQHVAGHLGCESCVEGCPQPCRCGGLVHGAQEGRRLRLYCDKCGGDENNLLPPEKPAQETPADFYVREADVEGRGVHCLGDAACGTCRVWDSSRRFPRPCPLNGCGGLVHGELWAGFKPGLDGATHSKCDRCGWSSSIGEPVVRRPAPQGASEPIVMPGMLDGIGEQLDRIEELVAGTEDLVKSLHERLDRIGGMRR